MKYYIFYRENNKFDDILKDSNINKVMCLKISWDQHLMIGLGDKSNDRHYSYITLKYGEDITKLDTIDRTPIPGVDYMPKKDKSTFSKKVQ